MSDARERFDSARATLHLASRLFDPPLTESKLEMLRNRVADAYHDLGVALALLAGAEPEAPFISPKEGPS